MEQKKEKILIAEDDLFIAEVYFAKLNSEGFDVHMASNGEEALATFEKVNPAIVLLDILMPKMDGWEVLNKIRKINKDAIIIMLTNVGDKTSIDKAMEVGANDYFIKSFFTPEEIVKKIRQYIGKIK